MVPSEAVDLTQSVFLEGHVHADPLGARVGDLCQQHIGVPVLGIRHMISSSEFAFGISSLEIQGLGKAREPHNTNISRRKERARPRAAARMNFTAASRHWA